MIITLFHVVSQQVTSVHAITYHNVTDHRDSLRRHVTYDLLQDVYSRVVVLMYERVKH